MKTLTAGHIHILPDGSPVVTPEQTDPRVAQEIMRQLGGRRFRIMTGSHTFQATNSSLTMRLPRNLTRVHILRITLMPRDEYRFEAFKIPRRVSGKPWKEPQLLETREPVFCDNIQEVFERLTGLYTRL